MRTFQATGRLSIQPATSVYVRVGRMSMIWWFSTSATVVTKWAWLCPLTRTKAVSSSPMAVVRLSRLRSALSNAVP
jgi:hypothetical protein